MPRSLLSALTLTSLAAFAVVACAQQGHEPQMPPLTAPAEGSPRALPLTNAGFEAGLAGWTVREKVPMSSVNARAAHSGKLGLSVRDEDPQSGASVTSEPVPLARAADCHLSLWARSSGKNAGLVQLRFQDAAGKTLAAPANPPATSPVMLEIAPGQAQWQQHTLTVRAPEGARTVSVWIRSYNGALSSFEVDDLQLSTWQPEGEMAVPAAPTNAAPVPAGESTPSVAPKGRVAQPPVPGGQDGPAGPAPIQSETPAANPARSVPPYVVIKVDDLKHVNGRVHARWKRFAEYVRQKQIHAGIGLICDSLEGEQPEYFRWIKEQQASGFIEIWNHGYRHREWEENGQKMWDFKGPSYAQQKADFQRCQQLAREKLGFSLPVFGAPFNATDTSTVKVLGEDPETHVWLYGDAKNSAGKVVLDRVYPVNIENPLFVPSLDKFVEGYNKHPKRQYFVIQGHAAKWDDARFAEFTRIVDFLLAQKAVFLTPSELGRRLPVDARGEARNGTEN